MPSYGQGAGTGAQAIELLDSELFLAYPNAIADRCLVFVACSLPSFPVAIDTVLLGGLPGQVKALSSHAGVSCSIWEVVGAIQLPAFRRLMIEFAQPCDAVAYVLPLFDSQLGHNDLALGDGVSMSVPVHGVGVGSLLFSHIAFPGQVFDSFAAPQVYIQSLGAFNGGPVKVFHFVTVTPGEPGGPTVLGAFSQPTPWCAAFLEVK